MHNNVYGDDHTATGEGDLKYENSGKDYADEGGVFSFSPCGPGLQCAVCIRGIRQCLMINHWT